MMSDVLMELITNIRTVRKEVKDYREPMGDWKKTEHAISLKERNEQQASVKRYSCIRDNGYRIEEEVSRTFKQQDTENYRLKQQISNIAFEKTETQKQFVDLDKKYKELDFVIGQDEGGEVLPDPNEPQ